MLLGKNQQQHTPITAAKISPVCWPFLAEQFLKQNPSGSGSFGKSMSLCCTWILQIHRGLWYQGRGSVSAHPILWHPVSGCAQRELWNLNSALIHSPGRNIVTSMPLGLQKQLESRAVPDIWWSNLSFLGRFFNWCCADKALYRTSSCSSSCVSQCPVSSLLPSLILLTYSSPPEAREKAGLLCWLSAMGKIIFFSLSLLGWLAGTTAETRNRRH